MPSHIPFYAGFVADLIQVVGGDSWFHLGSDNVEDLSRQAADLAHTILGLGIQELDLIPAQGAALGYARGSIVGVGDRLGHGASLRQRVDGSQGPGEGVGREGVELASRWIRFRDDLRRNEVVNDTVLSLAFGRLVHRLVIGLWVGRIPVSLGPQQSLAVESMLVLIPSSS